MSEHDELRLRVITVSARAALDNLHDDTDAATVRSRADALLAELERDVRADGPDPELLNQVARARRGLVKEG